MTSRRIIRWIHVVGYVTTVIVAAEIGTLGYFAYEDWHRRRIAIEDSRTHDGPVASRPERYADKSASRLLSRLPPLDRLPDGTLRLAVMPSFGRNWFALALVPHENGTVVTLTVAHRDMTTSSDIVGWEAPSNFVVPNAAYSQLTSQLDRLAEHWSGEAGAWTDGTPIAFEHKKNGRVISGVGNSPNFHGKIATLFQRILAPYSPTISSVDEYWTARGEQ